MINAQRQYSVGEANGSVYTPYTASTWMPSSSLAMGYGMTNTVQVTRDAGGLFTLSLNGDVTMTFRDGRTPLHSGGGDGYLVVISPGQLSCHPGDRHLQGQLGTRCGRREWKK